MHPAGAGAGAVSAPTVLDDQDDLATGRRRRDLMGLHLWTTKEGRTLHAAACPCWRRPLGRLCRLCVRDHALYGVCRWARWLGRG